MPTPLLAAPPAAGTAARGTVSGDDNYRATVHLNRAAELFQRGLYDEVAEELQEAYRLNPLPRILCNIAQAYRKGGRQKEAAEQYDLCLRTDPKLTARERAEFTEYREQALAALALVTVPAAHPEPKVTPASAAPVSPPMLSLTVPPSEKKRPIYKRAWFWCVLGGVVAAGAVTTGILVWQLGKPDPVSLLPPGTPVLRF